ncbi:hypothetical protein [Caenimonas koreensis]|uniref:Tetratricopeptide repeat-containing protein n=1 Tax=Caenimonas koreensis DSM 17982 TaxID=1121255 RepID=A0A844BAU7_9BURK|nr:hypothetical protein [Caenimonas koreensis]MRD48699.1 hypothetical protein [Caenimonas koreensis DSM 17982]
MNPDSATSRLTRLEPLLAQDPQNLLLLADATDAAMAAGALARAEELVACGLELSAGGAAWQFRRATLRIAQRQLDEARAILASLAAADDAGHPAIVHNLAYIEFLQGHHAASAAVLRPWVDGPSSSTASATAPATQALWLRSLHHMGSLEEAWAWTQKQLLGATLSARGAAVASLIALERSDVDAANRLAQQALDGGVREIEPLVARAGAALAARDTALAKGLFNEALLLNPADARSWSGLGLAAMLDHDFAAAKAAFEKAVATGRGGADSLQGLAWAQELLRRAGLPTGPVDRH